MSRRILIAAGKTQIEREFHVTSGGFRHSIPSPHFIPGAILPIVLPGDDENHRAAGTAEWGFRPTWAAGAEIAAAGVGLSRVLQNGLYREAITTSRCLVPITGFHYSVGDDDVSCTSDELLAVPAVFTVRVVRGRSVLSLAMLERDDVPGIGAAPIVLAPAAAVEWFSAMHPGSLPTLLDHVRLWNAATVTLLESDTAGL